MIASSSNEAIRSSTVRVRKGCSRTTPRSLVGQRAVLVEDRVRHTQLAEIMQQRRAPHQLHALCSQPHLACAMPSATSATPIECLYVNGDFASTTSANASQIASI